MATIREIAELAGVSRGTVDRVLNRRGAVNPRTEAKIWEIARALDYKPNRAGVVLAARKKNLMLGVVLFGRENPFFDEVMQGIRAKQEEFESYNCTISVYQVGESIDEQLHAIDELIREGMNGLALAPYNDSRIIEKINECEKSGIPVVTLNTDVPDSSRIAYVGSNYYHSGQTAAGLMSLMSAGIVHAGIVTGSPNILCHTERIAGFRQCLREKGGRIRIVDVILTGDDDIVSYNKTAKLLAEHPEINALFFAAGGVYGGCRAIIDQNRQNNMTVITFDDITTTREFINTGIISATICQQPQVQGAKPLDILFTYLTTGELPGQALNYTEVDIRIKENLTFHT